MSNTPPTSEPSSENNHTPFWDAWTRNAKWRDDLARKTSHKALGVSDMGDITSSTKSGMGWKELAAIGATLLGVGGLYQWAKNDTTAAFTPPPASAPVSTDQPTPAPPQPAAGPVDSEYEIRFYDADGNLIDVPRRPAELQPAEK